MHIVDMRPAMDGVGRATRRKRDFRSPLVRLTEGLFHAIRELAPPSPLHFVTEHFANV